MATTQVEKLEVIAEQISRIGDELEKLVLIQDAQLNVLKDMEFNQRRRATERRGPL